MRSRGRLTECTTFTYNERHPVILSDHHRVTELLIEDCHRSHNHAGNAFVLNKLRDGFWILRSRRTVKSVLNKCVTCRRYRVRPSAERFAPLPSDRCEPTLGRAFEHSGIDYLGPFVSAKECKKFYVLLITCLTIRAVHLEVTQSLDVPGFMQAFQRFVSRRGCPLIIRSDNAKTFLSASKLVEQRHGTSWSFNTSRAPWTGGCWERMVRTVKAALRFSLKGNNFSYIDLCTYVCQAEGLVNSRPITYMNGHDDEVRPLCPNHFLQLCASDNAIGDCSVSQKKLAIHFLSSSCRLQKFFTRWRAEYVRHLQCNRAQPSGTPLKVNDVALLDNGSKRTFWPLCRVVEVYPGRDGKVRTVKIKCAGKHLIRPTKLLYHLESSP